MEIIISENYESMSAKAADHTVRKLQGFHTPLLCVASGDSPKGLYEKLGRQKKDGTIDVSGWFFLGLDEWVGLRKNDEGSCRFMLNRDLFYPLQLNEKQIICFDGKASDLNEECKRVEDFIKKHFQISVAVLGLGMNGHIGLNEPGTPINIRTHVSDIAEVTKNVGQKYFPQQQELTKGITLGLGTLLDAEHLILVASGKKKADIVKRALEGEITENIPASLLRNHKSFSVFLDKDAASMLKI